MEPQRSCRAMQNFTDILWERHQTSDFDFMSKYWQPLETHSPLCKTDPEKIKDDVFSSRRVKDVIEELCRETGKSKSELNAEAQKMLNEIGYDHKMSVIRCTGYFLLKILKRTCDGLLINEGSIDKIKEVMGKAPVVFAPTHRSYGDFILLSYICYCYNLEIPVVAAGMDFQSMWLLGRVMRNCCAFFMRRSFGKDKLYWAVFGEFVRRLVTDCVSPLEFFIEGTRSRTAKSLSPKLGFLSMVMEPFFNADVDDILIVPANVSYDRTLEESLYAYELLGVPKPKESTSGFLKAMRVLNVHYGRVYVEFAEPISLKQFTSMAKFRLFAPRHLESNNNNREEREGAAVADLAFHIVRAQQRLGVITPFNIIALILNDSLFTKPHPITWDHLIRELCTLKPVLEHLGALVDFSGAPTLEEGIQQALRVHSNLVSFSQTGLLEFSTKPVDVKINQLDSAIKRDNLLPETMEFAAPAIMLQHYVNPCLHHLITPALIVIIVKSMEDWTVRMTVDDLYIKYCFLRNVLSHDFVLCEDYAYEDFNFFLPIVISLGLVCLFSNEVLSGDNARLQSLLSGLLHPFLLSHLVLCTTIKESTSILTEKQLIKESQRKIEMYVVNGHPVHPYSLSLDTFGCGVRSMENLRAIEKQKENGVTKILPGPALDSVIKTIDQYICKFCEKLEGNPVNPECRFKMRGKL